jgi:penicillin amidase
MPHALNPQDGVLVTCNHRIVPDDYPHFLGNVWMNGYRAHRIVDYFKSKDKLAFEDMRQMHVDFTCLPGKEFVTALDGFSSDDPDVNLALEILRLWNGELDVNNQGGAMYEIARFTLVCNLFEPKLGHELLMRWMGEGFHPLLYHSSEFYGHDTTALLRLLQAPENVWIKEAGGKQALLEKSLKEAVSWLRGELGTDHAAWTWGKLHKITFAHSLALQKPLDMVFNRGPYPLGGDTDTPCQTAMRPGEPYECKAWAPSVRFFFDMGDLTQSKAMYAPGQSGQLGSPHYDDLIQPWLQGEYHPLLWTRAQVEQEAGKLLTLVPAL